MSRPSRVFLPALLASLALGFTACVGTVYDRMYSNKKSYFRAPEEKKEASAEALLGNLDGNPAPGGLPTEAAPPGLDAAPGLPPAGDIPGLPPAGAPMPADPAAPPAAPPPAMAPPAMAPPAS